MGFSLFCHTLIFRQSFWAELDYLHLAYHSIVIRWITIRFYRRFFDRIEMRCKLMYSFVGNYYFFFSIVSTHEQEKENVAFEYASLRSKKKILRSRKIYTKQAMYNFQFILNTKSISKACNACLKETKRTWKKKINLCIRFSSTNG